MVNKNDTSDLEKFLTALAGIIFVFFAFLALIFFAVDNNRDIQLLKAKLSDYIHRQWDAGGK